MWEYRVVRRDGGYFIHEAYLDKSGKPTSITEDAVTVYSEDPGGIEWVLKMMLEALNRPYLDYEKFIGKD